MDMINLDMTNLDMTGMVTIKEGLIIMEYIKIRQCMMRKDMILMN